MDSNLWIFRSSIKEILRRYSETKSKHPWLRPSEEKTLKSVVLEEEKCLKSLQLISDLSIDTTSFNIHQLRDWVERACNVERKLKIEIISFGYKNGLPDNLNLLFDVRFLDNPYYNPLLRELSGLDDAVFKEVTSTEEAKQFLGKALDLLDYLIPLYHNENRIFLHIGIGCTGGQHRSVSISRFLADYLREKSQAFVSLTHRDAN